MFFYNNVTQVIDVADVYNNIDEFYKLLDVGFFKVRYERCAESDNKFVNSISTTRAQLINKGIIYPIRYKELYFTVPDFSGYIQRLEEYKQWCEEE